jgi:hypothetical protein
MKKIEIDLSTDDKGNILEIIGIVARTIQKAASRQEKHIFTTRVVRECITYKQALEFCKEYAKRFDIEIVYLNDELESHWRNRV